MLVDDIGDVTITNDGATILKLLEVEHPAAKVSMEKQGVERERERCFPFFFVSAGKTRRRALLFFSPPLSSPLTFPASSPPTHQRPIKNNADPRRPRRAPGPGGRRRHHLGRHPRRRAPEARRRARPCRGRAPDRRDLRLPPRRARRVRVRARRAGHPREQPGRRRAGGRGEDQHELQGDRRGGQDHRALCGAAGRRRQGGEDRARRGGEAPPPRAPSSSSTPSLP